MKFLFIILWAFRPVACDQPGCLVMHYPTPAHIEVCRTAKEVEGKDLQKDTRVWKYEIESGELIEIPLEPIIKKEKREVIKGYRLGKPPLVRLVLRVRALRQGLVGHGREYRQPLYRQS